MTDSFAHHVRIDQVRDGEVFELVADDAERESSRIGSASSRSGGWRRGRWFIARAM